MTQTPRHREAFLIRLLSPLLPLLLFLPLKEWQSHGPCHRLSVFPGLKMPLPEREMSPSGLHIRPNALHTKDLRHIRPLLLSCLLLLKDPFFQKDQNGCHTKAGSQRDHTFCSIPDRIIIFFYFFIAEYLPDIG